MSHHPYRIAPGQKVALAKFDPADDGGMDEAQAKKEFKSLAKRLVEQQELLYANASQSLLVVFQAMDTGGKDSTIHHVLGPLNPQGSMISNFKAPSTIERAHDFLWRIHQRVPPAGYIGIFNRSHYEDVLVVRVHDMVPAKVWKKRYKDINAFEKLLAESGCGILKFYLHISKDYQKDRLQRRLDKPAKHWKFSPADLAERAHWDAYMQAYEEALSRCSTRHAPWYVVPAQTHWFRDLIVARAIVEHLEGLHQKTPQVTFDPKAITIED